jgi:hypothetical protein
MSIQPSFDVSPNDPDGWMVFTLIHDVRHQTERSRISAQGTAIPGHDFSAITKDGSQDWQEDHYQEHLAICTFLGFTNDPTLESVDLTDANAFTVWMASHGLEHKRIDDTLLGF